MSVGYIKPMNEPSTILRATIYQYAVLNAIPTTQAEIPIVEAGTIILLLYFSVKKPATKLDKMSGS